MLNDQKSLTMVGLLVTTAWKTLQLQAFTTSEEASIFGPITSNFDSAKVLQTPHICGNT